MAAELSGVVVVIDQEKQLLPLVSSGYRLATARNEQLTLIVVSETDSKPAWLEISADYDRTRIGIQIVPLAKLVARASRVLRSIRPALVLLGMMKDGKSLVREELAPLMQRIKCPVAIVRRQSEFKQDQHRFSFLVPFQNDENSRFALRTALDLDPDALVTAAMVMPEPIEYTDRLSQERDLTESLAEWADEERVIPKLLVGSRTADLLEAETQSHDTIVMGVGHGLVFLRAATGDTPTVILNDVQRELIHQTTKPAVVLRAYQGWLGVVLSMLFTQGDRFMPDLTAEERIAVYREIRRSARPTQDFFIMIGASASNMSTCPFQPSRSGSTMFF